MHNNLPAGPIRGGISFLSCALIAALQLTLTTQAQNIALVGATLVSENCTNGAIDPGEVVTVNFTLTNLVSVATTNLVATLSASNGVFAPSAPQNYGGLVGGGAAATRAFTFTATGQCGGTITTTLRLQDGTVNLGTRTTAFSLGVPRSIVLSENFDGITPPALPSGWTAVLTGAGAAWKTTNALRDTLPNSAFAPDPDAISDNRLTSPQLAITTASAQLIFRHSFNAEPSFDGGVLEISIDSGAFTDILAAGGSFAANGYNQVIDSHYFNPLTNRSAWSGNSGGFITTVVSLPAAAAGHLVQLRWRFGSDNSGSATGWYIDSISLADGFDCCATRPLIQSISRFTNTAIITWSAVTGRTYRVQFKTNVTDVVWTDLAGDVNATGSVASKTNSNVAAEQRFYRVGLLP